MDTNTETTATVDDPRMEIIARLNTAHTEASADASEARQAVHSAAANTLEDSTKADLQSSLDEHGCCWKTSDTKADLIDTLAKQIASMDPNVQSLDAKRHDAYSRMSLGSRYTYAQRQVDEAFDKAQAIMAKRQSNAAAVTGFDFCDITAIPKLQTIANLWGEVVSYLDDDNWTVKNAVQEVINSTARWLSPPKGSSAGHAAHELAVAEGERKFLRDATSFVR